MVNQHEGISRQPSAEMSVDTGVPLTEVERPRIQAHLAIEADGAIFEFSDLDFFGLNNNPNGLSIRLKYPGHFADSKFKRTKIQMVQSVITSPFC